MASSLEIVRRFFPNVHKVKDGTKAIEIDVTKADISSSQAKNHVECALAVACKRKYRLDGVIVSRKVAYLVKDNMATRYEMPESTTREIVSLDRGGGFTSGTYEFVKPNHPLGVSGSQRETGKRPPIGRVGPHKPRHFTANIRVGLAGVRRGT